MRVAIIGRSELLYNTALLLRESGYEIPLVITAKEAPEYTKKAADFERFAQDSNAHFISTPRIMEAIEDIKELPMIDIAVSVNYSGIIPQEIIDCFPLGVLNAHGGDLPRYRGNACQAWAIINGEDKIGLCIHSMIGGELDSGDIIAREYLEIDINTKVTKAWAWMNERIPSLYLDSIKKLSDNSDYVLEKQSKDPEDALRCYPRKPEDGRIDWTDSAENILRLINACNAPYAGAFCFYKDKKVIVWDAHLAEPENFLAIPGQITARSNGYIEIASGKGKLCLKEVELEGEKMTADKMTQSLRDRLT